MWTSSEMNNMVFQKMEWLNINYNIKKIKISISEMRAHIAYKKAHAKK